MARDNGERLIHSSVPWVASIFAFVAVLLKVISVAHATPTTIYGLIGASGITTVILAALGVWLFAVALFGLYLTGAILALTQPSSVERAILETGFVFSLLLAAILTPPIGLPFWYFVLDAHFEWPLTRRLHKLLSKPSPDVDEQLAALRKKKDALVEAQDREVDEISEELKQLSSAVEQAEADAEADDSLKERLAALKERISARHGENAGDELLSDAEGLVRSLEEREVTLRRKVWRYSLFSIVIAGLTLVWVIALDDPWLPAETFTLSRAEEPLTAYALKLEDERLLVLQDEPRQLVWLKVSDIVERSFCQIKPAKDSIGILRPSLELIYPRTAYPPCQVAEPEG